MSNIEYFKKQVKCWSKKFRLGKINLIKCTSMWYCASIKFHNGKKYMYYNNKHMRGLSKARLLHLVFHELGHFKHPVWNDDHFYTRLEKITAEYLAEGQSMKWLKRYRPLYYKLALKRISKKLKFMSEYPKKYDYYFEAFSQIPEYAKVINNG